MQQRQQWHHPPWPSERSSSSSFRVLPPSALQHLGQLAGRFAESVEGGGLLEASSCIVCNRAAACMHMRPSPLLPLAQAGVACSHAAAVVCPQVVSVAASAVDGTRGADCYAILPVCVEALVFRTSSCCQRASPGRLLPQNLQIRLLEVDADIQEGFSNACLDHTCMLAKRQLIEHLSHIQNILH